jgi:hypothetical protein
MNEPLLRRWKPHIEPDDLRNTLPELRCVRDRYATDLLRLAMPRATFEQSFPFVLRQVVHEKGDTSKPTWELRSAMCGDSSALSSLDHGKRECC